MRRLNTLYMRLFLLILSCMLALILVFSAAYYHRLTGIIHSQTQEMAEKNISQTVDLFDLLLKGYDSITKSLNSNYEMLRLIKERDRDPTLNVVNDRTITNNIGAIYYSRDDIASIYVITNGGVMYNYERRFAGVVDANYADKAWYRKLKESAGEMVWLGMYRGSVLNEMQQEEPVFVFGRQLYDLTDLRSVGIVIFETYPNAIMSALSNASLSSNSKVYITDQDSRIIASTGQDASWAITSDDAGGKRPLLDSGASSAGDNLVVSAKPRMADWSVTGITPRSDISARIAQTRQYLIGLIAALVIISTVIATVISRTISSPLRLVIREMRRVETGNFHGSLNVRSYDEINSLAASFNRMVNRMDELIERITLASVSEKNAELAALQSQVNPHFLYNTLDMIYWMLDEQGSEKLGRVILSLSHMFRYSSDWEEAAKTTLRQELEQMKHYMTIIENRLAGRVSTVIEVGEEWLDTRLPKMTLQPILENAVKSGLEPSPEAGVIRVYARTTDRELQIVVEDNGVGMDPGTLEWLRESLQVGGNCTAAVPPYAPGGPAAGAGAGSGPGRGGPAHASGQPEGPAPAVPAASRRRGIGLPNVHRRLALQYGEEYGLRIDSLQGAGTTVTIALPIHTVRRDIHGTAHRG